MEKIKATLIGWIGVKNRITRELALFSCQLLLKERSGLKTIKMYRRIVSEAPKERFQIDTALLPAEMHTDSVIYLLNMKDHFSKYVWCFLINDKSSDSVAENIESVFAEGHIFHSDNGAEFKGAVATVLKTYDIKHITGRSYNQKCQGLIENTNKYIKKVSLLAYLIRESPLFDIQAQLDRIATGYNQKKHTVTKYKPNELYNSKNKNC